MERNNVDDEDDDDDDERRTKKQNNSSECECKRATEREKNVHREMYTANYGESHENQALEVVFSFIHFFSQRFAVDLTMKFKNNAFAPHFIPLKFAHRTPNMRTLELQITL